MTKFPEHEKMQKVRAESEAIGLFLDTAGYHLSERHVHTESCFDSGSSVLAQQKWARYGPDDLAPCGYREGSLQPVNLSIEKILAKYFDIDLAKIEKEKRQMLEDLRRMQS